MSSPASKTDGGPAFPGGSLRFDEGECFTPYNPGMSFRAYAATAILAGMHASMTSSASWPQNVSQLRMAAVAVAQADALIAALVWSSAPEDPP